MLKIAIVGCGKIADAHAAVIQRIEQCEIVGVYDREPLMAEQLCDRFPVKRWFNDFDELLQVGKPDVVHVTTSPESHFEIAKLSLEHGCHVYVEKPFTVNAREARTLIELAERKQLKLTAGHNDQFSHVARRMRSLIGEGYLGGPPVHMESVYCYDVRDPTYAKALLGDKNHWVRRLPGKLLQNVISHGIARIAEFLPGDDLQVIVHAFVSPLFKGIGETEIVDELRVILCNGVRTTAYFTFSTQMKPSIHEFRIYGPTNGLILDQDHEILIRLRGKSFKSYAEKFVPPVLFARQHLGNLKTNVQKFLTKDFHFDAGMKYLTEAFYRSIRQDGPLPISFREILLTAEIMDAIFGQINSAPPRGCDPAYSAAQTVTELQRG